MLSRSYAEYYMQSNIDNIDLGWDSEKIYLWFSLFPSMNEGYKLEALDNDITYHEKFVYNSISLQLGMKSELTDYEYELFNNSTLDQLDRLISAFDEMLDDDGITHRTEGKELVLAINYEKMPTGGYRVTGIIQ